MEFVYRNSKLTVMNVGGQPWFSAKNVCNILELGDVSKTCSRLDEDDRLVRTLFVSGQQRNVLLINECGLYELVLTSRKPEAIQFKRWITHEVIPSIRRKGYYMSPKLNSMDLMASIEHSLLAMQGMLTKMRESDNRIEKLETNVISLSDHVSTLDQTDVKGDERQQLVYKVNKYSLDTGQSYPKGWQVFLRSWNRAFHENLEKRKTHFKRANNIIELTTPEYLERVNRLKDGLRIANKMLEEVKAA
jgi:prophage antirepressor-like protein